MMRCVVILPRIKNCLILFFQTRSIYEEAVQNCLRYPFQKFQTFLLFFLGDTACEISRSYNSPKLGIPETKVAIHVGIHFYVDKELMVTFLLVK